MQKKGGNVSNWKRRYLVLDANGLKYFVKEDMKELKGSVPMDTIIDVVPAQHLKREWVFEVRTRARTFVVEVRVPEDDATVAVLTLSDLVGACQGRAREVDQGD